MDVFLDSHKFSKNEEGSFVHTRNLGQRDGHTYPEAKWSDVTIHGVNIDDSMFWHFRNDCLVNFPSGKGSGEIIVGERKIDADIRSSVSGSVNNAEFEKGTGEKKTYFRKRNIPKSKKKKFPVKPINEIQLTKKNTIEEKYDEVSATMRFSTSEKDPGESIDSAVVIDRDIFKNGYGLYNLTEGEKIGEKYRGLGIKRGFHLINPNYDCLENKIGVFLQEPENYWDIKEVNSPVSDTETEFSFSVSSTPEVGSPREMSRL